MKQTSLFLLVTFFSWTTFGQESHYWKNQHGPTSNFLGGAVTGGVRDNSHIFYNPGAAAFTTNFNISLQSDALFYETLYLKDGAGEGKSLYHNNFETAPQMLAFTYGKKDNPNWRTSFGYLNMTYSNIKLRSRYEELIDIYANYPGDEIYVGSWNYRNRIREDWYGAAVTKKFGDHLGIGASLFVTYRSYEYIQSQDQNLYKRNANSTVYDPVRYYSISDNMDGAAAGLLLKIGAAYEIGDFKLGVTVTTPRAQLDFLSSMTLNSTLYAVFLDADSSIAPTNYSLLYERAESTYRSPWVVDFGIMKNFFETDIYLRISYHSKVEPYEMIEAVDQSEISKIISQSHEGAGVVTMAHKEIWNVGIGWNRMYTKKFGLMAGLRTDFNYVDYEALGNEPGFTPAISYWNLYHFSAGTNVVFLKHNFTVGFTYSIGRDYNGMQLVNLTPPESDELINSTEAVTTVQYDKWQLTIGYVYNFW